MYKYYLLYNNYIVNEKTKEGELGHLLAYNIGKKDCEIDVNIIYEDGEKNHLKLLAYAGKSTESNWKSWNINKTGKRFAYIVESPEPLVCQVTIGNNNTLNDYSFHDNIRTDYRETVVAYTAIDRLANDWYHADGIVINQSENCWVRESEWLILLNPEKVKAKVDVRLDYDDTKQIITVELEPVSVKYVFMDDIVRQNKHYGAYLHSDNPIAAQWLRTIRWFDKPELMTYWSLPLVSRP